MRLPKQVLPWLGYALLAVRPISAFGYCQACLLPGDATPTPIPVCTNTPTPTPTDTPTETPTPTFTPTPSDTPTPTNTPTPTFTPTDTLTPTPTDTPTSTPTATPTATATPVPLLQPEGLSPIGSFWIPPGDWRAPYCQQQAYSLGAIAYKQSDNTLFVTSHGNDPTCVGQFSVPNDLGGSAKAALVQQVWTRVPSIVVNGTTYQTRVRGLLWDAPRDRLCWTRHVWYNQANLDSQDLGCSHADGSTDGPWEVGSNNKVAGPMAQEPSGKVLIGLTVAQNVSSGNLGPAAYEVDLAAPAAALPLMEHGVATREVMSGVSPVDSPWGMTWMDGLESMGAAIIDRTLVRSLEEGDHYFYGLGSNFVTKYGFTPRGMGQGYHHDHYSDVLYFYDLADLEKVRGGQKLAADVHPYAYKQLLSLPAEPLGLGGLAVDPSTRHLFLASQQKDKGIRIYVYGY